MTKPKSEGKGEEPVESVGTLSRISDLEDNFKRFIQTQKFNTSVSRFTVGVLGAGFIALLVTVILALISTFSSQQATETEFIKSVQDLTNQNENLKESMQRLEQKLERSP